MAFSTNTFTFAGGAQTFTLSLALGYLKESDIRVFVVGEVDGGQNQIYRTFTFDSEFVVRVTDPLTVNDEVTVERTVSKTALEVDFETGGDITGRNMMILYKQVFMAQHELLDGRIAGLDLTQIVADIAASTQGATDSAAAALVSENAAAASAATASTDAGTASTDAATATTQAGLASTSAGNASTSATAASGSASAAATSAAAALVSEGLADADRVQTGLDAVATAADRVQTGLDRTATGTSETNAAASAAAALVSEGLADTDAIATAADRVQTGLDVTAAAGSASTATTQAGNASTSAAAALVSEGLADADAVSTAADLVLTDADQIAAAASAGAASTSATNAATSADEAAASALEIDHSSFVKKDGSTAFTSPQTGVAPTVDLHLATKKYVDDNSGGAGTGDFESDGSVTMTAALKLAPDAPTLIEEATRKDYVDGIVLTAQTQADLGVTNAATADGKAVTAQGTADTAITNAATADAKAVTADGKAVAAQTTADGKTDTTYVDNADALKANKANAALTGVPTAPTASVATDTTQLATTAFVLANAGGGGGFTFQGPTTTITGGAAFLAIPAGANRITIMILGTSSDSNEDHQIIQIGDSGGFEITGYDGGVSSASSDRWITDGFAVNRISGSANTWDGVITLTRATGNTWLSNGNTRRQGNGNDVDVSSGIKTLTGELDRIQFILNDTNLFTDGNISVMIE